MPRGDLLSEYRPGLSRHVCGVSEREGVQRGRRDPPVDVLGMRRGKVCRAGTAHVFGLPACRRNQRERPRLCNVLAVPSRERCGKLGWGLGLGRNVSGMPCRSVRRPDADCVRALPRRNVQRGPRGHVRAGVSGLPSGHVLARCRCGQRGQLFCLRTRLVLARRPERLREMPAQFVCGAAGAARALCLLRGRPAVCDGVHVLAGDGENCTKRRCDVRLVHGGLLFKRQRFQHVHAVSAQRVLSPQ